MHGGLSFLFLSLDLSLSLSVCLSLSLSLFVSLDLRHEVVYYLSYILYIPILSIEALVSDQCVCFLEL